jgi:MYXO-CTERM domain-containing protein
MAFQSTLSRALRIFPGVAALAGACVLLSGEARACGGLFCNAAQPVNQAAERIIFAKNDDGTVSAVIEIQYEGPSNEFAWVLPVPAGQVDVSVGSTISLDRIEQQSNPLYILNIVQDENCPQTQPVARGPVSASAGSLGDVATEEGAAQVEVVASGTAGPYDYEQIMVNPDLADPAQVAVDWLVDNDYEVGELGPDVLRPYLEQEMNLIAFRLTKGSETGSIRPIRLSYESEQPFIPLRPTAVAANPDMGIKVWVLGDSRAIPQNYRHLELNEARLDWFNPNATYNDVVIAAADEAGGQGFVTEQAGPAGNFTEAAYASWEEQNWDSLRTGQFETLEQFFQSATNVFGTYDGFIDVIRDAETVPLRDGATAEQFVGCVSCYFQIDVPVRNEAYPPTPFDPETDPIVGLSVTAFLAEMERLVIAPLEDTRTLFEENSTVTRFYTTMSADEMTEDPAFDYNDGLEDVDNVHTATQVMQCDLDTEWRVELAQGLVLEGNGRTWPVAENSELPFNLRVLQLSTTGEGDVVEDNALVVGQMLTDLGIGRGTDELMAADDTPSEQQDDEATDETDDTGADDEPVDDEPSDDEATDDDEATVEDDDASSDADEDGEPVDSAADSDDGCGCAVVGKTTSPGALSGLGLLGLGLFARRRRN